mgnify:CR=1 FL=1
MNAAAADEWVYVDVARVVPAADIFASQLSVQAGPRAERGRGHPGRNPRGRLHLWPRPPARRSRLDRAGTAPQFPRGPDTAGHVRKPVPRGLGRGHRRHSVLGAATRRRAVPGLRDQLRPSRLPRPLVRAVAALHVSLSWRRVLRRRLARVGPTASGPVRVRAPGARRAALGTRRADSHAVRVSLRRTAERGH